MGWQVTFEGTKRSDLTDKEKVDPYVSKWEGGKVVDLDELSPDFYDGVAAREDGNDSWWGVYRFPCSSGARMLTIARAAAEHGGAPIPDKPSNMREAHALMECFERTLDIEDRPTSDGFPPKPSETVTPSSSGLSDVSDGDLQTSDENPSATS